MSNNRNTESLEALKAEVKALKVGCANICDVIENNPPDISTENNDQHKANCYIKGLETAVQNSRTQVSTDENILTAEFLNKMKQKITQVDELTAYITGANHDLDTEINRLKSLCSTVQEAVSKPELETNVIQPVHIQKAKDRFRLIKNELQGLLESMLPNDHEDAKNILGVLMSANIENSSNYVTITEDNFEIINILKDLNIVAFNPYNHSEVKLNYS